MSQREVETILRGRTAFALRFWSTEPGAGGRALRFLLGPAEAAFRAGVRLRSLAFERGVLMAHALPIAVVSVGNLTVGGEGKTPFCRWLTDEFLRRGITPALLHGGYAADEPLLHRRWHPDVPVYAVRDRVAAAAQAARDGAGLVILDDGFQHRRIARDLDIVLVSAEGWDPHPHLLPNGPWREPPSALARAQLIVVSRRTASHDEAAAVRKGVSRFAPEVALAIAHLAPGEWQTPDQTVGPPGSPAIAVTSIARPALFADNAREAGACIEQLIAYPDHHAYTKRDVEHILRDARGRPIVTTEKDAVKLLPLAREAKLWILTQAVRIEAGAGEIAAALDALAK
ncbi:MAG: tetraacyldisaccharide 4'-kinase [Gemmatimonadetes bacterium]|nr:tetraacyldisaccharide 4'-kinase [Gemmatimonadota bacterium]